MVEFKHQDMTVAGVRTVVRSGGKVSDEAVVFVHGNPGSGEDFSQLLPKVAEFAYVIAPDMPGYGKSERPRDFDYTVQGYAAHLDALLTALGIHKVHLVLHDFGGPWGMKWASQHLSRVASFTLFNMGILVGYRWHKYARIWRTPILGELFQLAATRFGVRAMLNSENPKPFPDDFIDRMYDDMDWPMKRAVLKLYRATDPATLSEEVGPIFKPARIKALVLWGDGDTFLPVENAQAQRDYFDADIHIMRGCGHWPMIDDPAAVERLVVPFLRERVLGRLS